MRLKSVTKRLKSQIIIKKVTTIHNFFQKFFKKKPIIGILGLNPHNGEMKKNSEELV